MKQRSKLKLHSARLQGANTRNWITSDTHFVSRTINHTERVTVFVMEKSCFRVAWVWARLHR